MDTKGQSKDQFHGTGFRFGAKYLLSRLRNSQQGRSLTSSQEPTTWPNPESHETSSQPATLFLPRSMLKYSSHLQPGLFFQIFLPNFVRISHSSHCCLMVLPSFLLWFHQPNNVSWRLPFAEFLLIQVLPSSTALYVQIVPPPTHPIPKNCLCSFFRTTVQVSHPYKRKTRFCFVNSGVCGSHYENGLHNPYRTPMEINTAYCKNILPVVH
jgi:hypothetical protein